MLENLELYCINADYNIFILVAGIKGAIVSAFIDDIKIMEVKGTKKIEWVKIALTATFETVDISSISFYLGLKIKRDFEKRIFKLLQLAYIDKILAKYHLNQAKLSNMSIKEKTIWLSLGL